MPSRPDLAAMVARLSRELAELEAPALAAHDLTLWEYMTLTALAGAAAPTQRELAEQIGRDTTRLITTLDALQARGLVDRVADPRDRRNRIVSLTAEGRARHRACRRAIRTRETSLLARLDATTREAFVRALVELTGQPDT